MDSVIPTSQVDVLVVAAHGPELRGMRGAIGERFDGTVRGVHVTGKTIGIGLAVAGASVAKRAFQLSPRVVIHLGTCGVYPGDHDYRPNDVLVADRMVLLDRAVIAGRSAFPEPMQTELTGSGTLAAGLVATGGERCFRAPVASPLAATTDDAFAAEVPVRLGAHGENLEAFAVAHASLLAEIPFVSVLAATHVVGSQGQDHRAKFERPATFAAAEVVINWLSNGAQGMPHG